MTSLGELIAALEATPADYVSPIGIAHPHSFRGDYSELAFEPAPPMTAADMLGIARSALGKTYQGYKGGNFEMGEWTPVHMSFEGSSTDYFPLVALGPATVALSKMNADDPYAFADAGLGSDREGEPG